MRIAALADTDAGALRRVADRVGPDRTAADYRELVDDPTLDAIAVCVPAQAHAEVALAAIGAGKHVFVEKPLALSLPDCDRMVDAAARAGVCAMVGFNSRRHAQAQRARDAIRRGELGAIDVVQSRLTSFHATVPAWHERRATGGGVLMELAIHHVDLWRWLTGDEVDEVFAYARTGEREDESAVIVARMGRGALATAAFAERTSRTDDVAVFGNGGSVALSLYRFDGYETASPDAVAGDGRARVRAALRFAPSAAVRDAQAAPGEDLPRPVAAFRRRDPRRDAPEPTLDDGRRALAVVLAAAESATTGQRARGAG
ncbi:MAG: Gfo/Idh/MocA family oxidoreductase [Betaproteobacteria bacterium]|nr:Gfo/Idh/MocA family oxidoreductase [Betaproteobacteria bacterium]